MPPDYLVRLHDARKSADIGTKAANLRFLERKGFQVPTTLVCTWAAYMQYLQNDAALVDRLRAELAAKLDPDRAYAVRSSANLEDAQESSFAGQFKSHLNARGVDDLLQGIWSIWAASQLPSVQAYINQHGLLPETLRMGVIIQEMVSPQISGVAFSKNPVTGMDEVIVEAVKGSGEALVQDGATPYRWISKWGAWIDKPEKEEIDLDLIEEVVRQTKAIARAFGQAVDLEWVYNGHTLYWVQLRVITFVDIPVYSNRLSRELFPGIIKPLIWSVNVPLVNGAWIRLLSELLGPNDLQPEQLAGYFYYRAYFNMGTLGQIFELMGFPRETLELLIGIEAEGPEKPSFKPTLKTYRRMPRLLRFVLDKARFNRRLDTLLPVLEDHLQTFTSEAVGELSEQDLLAEIDRLFPIVQETAYYNIVAPLLMYAYNRALGAQLGAIGLDLESFDLTEGLDELQQFEPNAFLARLHKEYNKLDDTVKAQIRDADYGTFRHLPGIAALQSGVAQFIAAFGHLSDSGNDFSHTPWRENPNLVLKMITDYVPVEARAAPKVGLQELDLSLPRRPFFQVVFNRARRYRWYREATSSLYTSGYGRFRDYFLALGAHFVRRGILDSLEDIYYLYWDEVREIAGNPNPGEHFMVLAEARKREIQQVETITPPSTIYGNQAPPVDSQGQGRLKGVPTSPGHHTGPVKVLRTVEDYDKLASGDVLVIPYSEVGWTPLFTRAGAVIAESGGILSHSSIVAREYGIPAVVSVPGACNLADNTIVTVDGHRGEILLVQDSHQDQPASVQ